MVQIEKSRFTYLATNEIRSKNISVKMIYMYTHILTL